MKIIGYKIEEYEVHLIRSDGYGMYFHFTKEEKAHTFVQEVIEKHKTWTVEITKKEKAIIERE